MEQDYKSFIIEYSSNLINAAHIIKYLNSYPQLLSEIEIENLIDSDIVNQQHEHWFNFYLKLNNSTEKQFFKPYWLPIKANSYDFFIDLSDKNYPLFEVMFIDQWYKKYIVKNIFQLLISPDNEKENITSILERNNQEWWNLIFTLAHTN